MSRGVVYSISPAGASELISRGEYYSAPKDLSRTNNGHVQHALELNDIHLALKRTRELVRWTPESDIRSRNELTNIPFVKDYDATVAVRIDSREYQFALEYERTPKAKRHYLAIRKRIEAETEFEHFLYLVSNHDLLFFLIGEFSRVQASGVLWFAYQLRFRSPRPFGAKQLLSSLDNFPVPADWGLAGPQGSASEATTTNFSPLLHH
jgi:hypothetical protein